MGWVALGMFVRADWAFSRAEFLGAETPIMPREEVSRYRFRASPDAGELLGTSHKADVVRADWSDVHWGCSQHDVALFLSSQHGSSIESGQTDSSGGSASTLFVWHSRAVTSERGCSSSCQLPRKRWAEGRRDADEHTQKCLVDVQSK